MTELLYHTDSYLQEFDALITDVRADERAVVLDRTAFYPGGGGQPCDFGSLTVNGVVYAVDKVKKQGDDVLHFLGGASPLPSVGSVSHGTLDWVRRHQLMRTHTALHILCGTVFRDYGAKVTGGDMDPLDGRMDFEFETMQKELVSVLRNTAHGFRLICTTSEDLEKLVDEGKFHDELFYRVASLPVELPPLRERRDDIPPLVRRFIREVSTQHDRTFKGIAHEAMQRLVAAPWPWSWISPAPARSPSSRATCSGSHAASWTRRRRRPSLRMPRRMAPPPTRTHASRCPRSRTPHTPT